jgi:hypothetical protein
MTKIAHFQQLEVWQQGHKLVLQVYQVTKDFPGDERFGLVSQMRGLLYLYRPISLKVSNGAASRRKFTFTILPKARWKNSSISSF